MAQKIVEKHITVDEATFKKLELIRKKEVRSKRAVVTMMIDKKFKEVFPNVK